MPGPKSDKIWSNAIRKAVMEFREVEGEDGSKEKLRRINLLANNLVAEACKGNVVAMKEIGDRLDGRPAQVQIHQGDEDGGPVRVNETGKVEQARRLAFFLRDGAEDAQESADSVH